MNDYEKGKLRAHWQTPGKLRQLLAILPLSAEDQAKSGASKQIAWMTGIGFDPAELDQVYYMLEEDGVIARDEVQSPPAQTFVCAHPGPRVPCQLCEFRVNQARNNAWVQYHLPRPLSEY